MLMPGPRLHRTLMLTLPPTCWLRLQSAVSENSTFEVTQGFRIRQMMLAGGKEIPIILQSIICHWRCNVQGYKSSD